MLLFFLPLKGPYLINYIVILVARNFSAFVAAFVPFDGAKVRRLFHPTMDF